jgi:hydroxymethylbilane synthase
VTRRVFTIGSRGSDLALWQARHVQSLLAASHPGDEFPIDVIRTQGDRIQDRPLYKVEDKGFFTKEIEDALLGGRIDLAVHSLKDLPTVSPEGLTVGAVPPREDPRDVWLSRDGVPLMEAARGSRIGTSSLRRQAQLRALRPDFAFEELRGNVPTRVRKLREGLYDAVVLARAGLYRLGLLPEDAQELPLEWILPAPGQGALGVQVRSDDHELMARVSHLEDRGARLAVTAERALLGRLQGGCLVPVGACGEMDGDRLRLRAMVADLSGDPIFRASSMRSVATMEEAATAGRNLADDLIAQGAGPILDRVRAFLRESSAPGSSPLEEPR